MAPPRRLTVWSPGLGQAAPAGPWAGGASHRNCLLDHRRRLLDPELAMIWGAWRRSSTCKVWAGGARDPFSTHPAICGPFEPQEVVRTRQPCAPLQTARLCGPSFSQVPVPADTLLLFHLLSNIVRDPRQGKTRVSNIVGYKFTKSRSRNPVHESPFTKVACFPVSEQYSLVPLFSGLPASNPAQGSHCSAGRHRQDIALQQRT